MFYRKTTLDEGVNKTIIDCMIYWKIIIFFFSFYNMSCKETF